MSQKITLPSLVSRRETYECSEYLVERSLCEYREEKEKKTKEDDYWESTDRIKSKHQEIKFIVLPYITRNSDIYCKRSHQPTIQ